METKTMEEIKIEIVNKFGHLGAGVVEDIFELISELIKKEREEAKKKISKRNKLIKRLKEEMQDNVYESWGEDN